MQSNDIEVLRHAIEWAGQDKRSALVTVLNTWGSSPRPPGSMAVIREDGMVVGSVSGGCVEDDLVEAVRKGDFATRGPVQILRYGVTAEEQARYRLPCGNQLRVAVETQWNVAELREALDAIRRQDRVVRTVNVQTGDTALRPAGGEEIFHEDETSFSAVLGPRYRLLIIGASELGRYLAGIATTLDYAVTVCDPREEYADGWDLTGTVLTREMPDDVVNSFACDGHTAVVAVTHDPKLDDLALMEALRTHCFYVGALGSQKTNEARKARLKLFDLDDTHVQKLRGPVGIAIGSRTPAEIAVSIAADLIATRNRVQPGAGTPAAGDGDSGRACSLA